MLLTRIKDKLNQKMKIKMLRLQEIKMVLWNPFVNLITFMILKNKIMLSVLIPNLKY